MIQLQHRVVHRLGEHLDTWVSVLGRHSTKLQPAIARDGAASRKPSRQDGHQEVQGPSHSSRISKRPDCKPKIIWRMQTSCGFTLQYFEAAWDCWPPFIPFVFTFMMGESVLSACAIIVILEEADLFDLQAHSWGSTDILMNWNLSPTHIPFRWYSADTQGLN